MTITLKSQEARIRWSEIVEDVHFRGAEVVVERYNKPVVAIVDYIEWKALKRQHAELLHERSERMRASDYMTQEEVDAGLRERGLLD